ncbi:TraR/DksA family transcriptional regulator [Streptomyces hygroscopicus]|uniref:TraR/DksA family transcriptional regulator n=1 Tax=Streptomyces hygroscopicus TaxID=1912 RepID=UPI00369698AF
MDTAGGAADERHEDEREPAAARGPGGGRGPALGGGGPAASELARAREAESALRADCDLDAADTGAKAMTLNELRTRAESDEALLERTVAALDRLRGGSFGICTRCGRPQGRERAMALPRAELCVLCAEAREAAGPDG